MTGAAVAGDVAVERLDVSASTIPTDQPESDGTLEWDSTTIVLVEAHAGGHTGIGWTYGQSYTLGAAWPSPGATRWTCRARGPR